MAPTKADAAQSVWWAPVPGKFIVSVENGLRSFYLYGYTYGPYYGRPLYDTRTPAYYGLYAPPVYYRPYYQQRHYYFYG